MKYRLLVGYKTVLISAIIHGNKPQTNKLHPWPLATGRERASRSNKQTGQSHQNTSGRAGISAPPGLRFGPCPSAPSAAVPRSSSTVTLAVMCAGSVGLRTRLPHNLRRMRAEYRHGGRAWY